MNDVLAVIPARSGSKSIPDKNIYMVDGHPLMAYSIRCALKSAKINRIIVSTDSEDYARIARGYSAEAYLRPAELASDTATDYDVLKHLLESLSMQEGYNPTYCVYLRPTTPLRDPVVVNHAIEAMMKDSNASSLRSVHQMSESAYKVVEMQDGFLKPLPIQGLTMENVNAARQGFPKTYHPNGYVDIFRPDIILNQQQLFGKQVLGWETDPVAEIDRLADIDLLEFQIIKAQHKVKELFT